LGDAEHVAGDREDAEQVVTEKHEPRTQLIGQPCPRRALHDVERCRDKGVAAEAEDDRGGVNGTQAAEARPAGIKGQIRGDEQPRDPIADQKAEHDPAQGENDAGAARIVVIVRQPALARFRLKVAGDRREQAEDGRRHDEGAVKAESVVSRAREHRQSATGKNDQNEERELTLGLGEPGNHGASSTFIRDVENLHECAVLRRPMRGLRQGVRAEINA
jgi:hypothetical protein